MSLSEDDLIAQRVRWWRVARKWSQQFVADRAGLTQGYISQIENGKARVDSRATLEAIAGALEVSYSDLTGAPLRPDSPAMHAAHSAVERIRLAHVALDHGEPVTPVMALSALRSEVEASAQAWQDCKYDRAGRELGHVISQLHAYAKGEHRQEALSLLVQALDTAIWTVRILGHYDLAYALTSRQAEAAQATESAALQGLAAFTRSLTVSAASSGDRTARATAYRYAVRAIDGLSVVAGTADELQVLGALNLAAARAQIGSGGDGRSHLAEAERLAARTGEGTALQLYFGPSNVKIWQVHFALEQGEGGRVRELAQGLTIGAVPSIARRAMFYRHYGLGLASAGKAHQEDAIDALLMSEQVAPGKIRLDALARDAVGHMLSRARATAGGAKLRRLANLAGVI